MSRYLITGISGSLAQLCAKRLIGEGHEVVGVDYRRRPDVLPGGIQFFRANYNKTKIVDVFRRVMPEVVLHLGRVGNLKEHAQKRFDLNVVGSQKVLDLAEELKVKRLVVLSTFHIYGAHPLNHVQISEEEPLRAGQKFPQLADAIQLDNLASTWIYKNRSTRGVVLRPTNIIGPNLNNAASNYLRRDVAIALLGFDPMWQFVHEYDMVDAILLAAQGDAVGVFNVAGNGEMPIQEALETAGARVLKIPGFAVDAFLRVSRSLNRETFPSYLLEFFRYACMISDAAFRSTFGYVPKVPLKRALRETRHGNVG